MRRILALGLALALSTALAADLKAIQGSQGALVGAIGGALDDPIGIVQHLPGYGLHIAARPLGTGITLAKAQADGIAALKALASTVKGLDRGDWVSFGYKTDEGSLIVRMRPGDDSTLESWVDGTRR